MFGSDLVCCYGVSFRFLRLWLFVMFCGYSVFDEHSFGLGFDSGDPGKNVFWVFGLVSKKFSSLF